MKKKNQPKKAPSPAKQKQMMMDSQAMMMPNGQSVMRDNMTMKSLKGKGRRG